MQGFPLKTWIVDFKTLVNRVLLDNGSIWGFIRVDENFKKQDSIWFHAGWKL